MSPVRDNPDGATDLAQERSDPPWVEEWAREYERHLPIVEPDHLHA